MTELMNFLRISACSGRCFLRKVKTTLKILDPRHEKQQQKHVALRQ